jgi:hypothetical protein
MQRNQLHLALDQNFPADPLGLRWPADVLLTRLIDVDPALTRDHEDWEILYHLDQRGDVHGFVTNDDDMLFLSREMVMLDDTRLTLIITKGVGHDPLQAAALLFLHLGEIARRIQRRARVIVLRPNPVRPERPGTYINRCAAADVRPPSTFSPIA